MLRLLGETLSLTQVSCVFCQHPWNCDKWTCWLTWRVTSQTLPSSGNSLNSVHTGHTEITFITRTAYWRSAWIWMYNLVRDWCSLSPKIFQTKLAAKTTLRKDPGLWQSDTHSSMPTAHWWAMDVSKWNNLEQSWQAEWPSPKLWRAFGHLGDLLEAVRVWA